MTSKPKKTKKREPWKDKLTREELRHLDLVCSKVTLRELRANLAFQGRSAEPCLYCQHIGRKLGLL